MFFIAVLVFVLAASVIDALLLVLTSRLVSRSSLTFGSAFRAAFLAHAVLGLVILALPLFGIRWRILSSPIATALLPLTSVVLLVTFLTWLGKRTDGDSVGLRHAAIAAVLASSAGYALGWIAWKNYAPSELASSRSSVSEQGFLLDPRSQLCSRNLARMLSDTGSGPKPGATREFEQRLEQDARTKGITMEEALKQELRKLGAKPPVGCDHLE
jgi:hypothetical protein